ncbi:MAG: U32 family peptidase [Candidatus Woesearchaeota archaeon]
MATKSKSHKCELLAPAGNREMLVAAIDAGCDSVYFGVKSFNMRVNAGNFSVSELPDVVKYCHAHKVKAYLTLNSIIYDNELAELDTVLKAAKSAKIDAIICWDMSVLRLAQKYKLDVHLSTQASVSNFEAVEYYAKLGVKRIILARELSLSQIKSITDQIIKRKLNVSIETFVHGAMCVAVSGRCFTSQFLFKRSANRGDCLQPCRRAYKVTDMETGGEVKLDNNYVMSAKDLCALPFIDKLKDAGISAFKIEGRCRSPEYVKVVISAYRKAIDNALSEVQKKELIAKLKSVYNRKFSSGFYLGLPTNDDFTDIYGSAATYVKEYIGYVCNFYSKINVAEVNIESNGLKVGDHLMIIGPTTGVKEQKLSSIEINHHKIKSAKKGRHIAVKLNFLARINDKVFVIRKA